MGKKARLKRLKQRSEQAREDGGSETTRPADSTCIEFGPGTRPPKIRFDSIVTTSTNFVLGYGNPPVDMRGHLVHNPRPGPGSGEFRNLVIGGVDDCPKCQQMLAEARRRSANSEIFSD